MLEEITVIVATLLFVYIVLGILTVQVIKAILSQNQCDCGKKSIKWNVPFNPNWLFELSGDFQKLYSGRCSCGNKHQALHKSNEITLINNQNERR